MDTALKTLKGTRILLVEDQEFNQLMVTINSERWECFIEVAQNGKEGVAKLETGTFDVVLMDIQMPEMDGIQATQYIRHHSNPKIKTVPIIALTSLYWEIDKCKNVGMNDFIEKPFRADFLYQKILSNIYHKPSEITLESTENRATNELYNLSILENMAEGNQPFIKKMLQLFIDKNKEIILRVNQAILKTDFETIKTELHKMKASVRTLQMKSIECLVVEAEELAKSKKDINQIAQFFSDVEQQLKKVFLLFEEEIKK